MRRPFGGTPDAVVIDTDGRPMAGRNETTGAVVAEGVVYADPVSGAYITDLLGENGEPISSLVPDQEGRLPLFEGPDDGTSELWVDFGAGRRALLVSTDIADRVQTIETWVAAPTITTTNVRSKGDPFHDVRAYGATGNGSTNDAPAIQAAFDAATAAGGTVLIPNGTYNCQATLRWKRDTTVLCGPKAVLLRVHNGTFLTNGVSGQNYPGYTGEGNLRWQGGTIDNQGTVFTNSSNCFSLGHAQNISLEGVTFKDVSGYHGVELNAVSRARIRDCRFIGRVDNSGLNELFRESIQIDVAKASWAFGAFGPYDSTPCKDVHISGCYFGPSGTPGTAAPAVAMGGHSATVGMHHEDIRFVNNECEGLLAWAVSTYAFSGLVISGNTITGCAAGIRVHSIDSGDVEDTKDAAGTQTGASQLEYAVTISGNILRNLGASTGDAIRVFGEPTGQIRGVAIVGNVIEVAGSGTRGINCLSVERLVISANMIFNTNSSSIYLDTVNECVVTGNLLRDTNGTGILFIGGTGLSVTGNYVRGTNDNGIKFTTCVAFTCASNDLRLIGGNGIEGITSCTDFVIANNVIKGASRTTNATSYGIRLSASCTRGTINSNRVVRWGSGNEYLAAFSATGTCSFLKRFGNSWQEGAGGTGTAITDTSPTPDTTATDQVLA
jgi:hypothetical protein